MNEVYMCMCMCLALFLVSFPDPQYDKAFIVLRVWERDYLVPRLYSILMCMYVFSLTFDSLQYAKGKGVRIHVCMHV